MPPRNCPLEHRIGTKSSRLSSMRNVQHEEPARLRNFQRISRANASANPDWLVVARPRVLLHIEWFERARLLVRAIRRHTLA